MTNIQILINNLNHPQMNVRLDSLRMLLQKISSGEMEEPVKKNDVNNHIHTTYSFSPYSPTKAVWMAYNAGLSTAGIMDHDSIGGALEFIQAGQIAGIATTIGVECRVDFSKTTLNGRRINNPDQNSIAYMALHGIPHTQINRVREFFKPYTEYRNTRNLKMVDKLNELTANSGIVLDFVKDVVPLSNFKEAGSITERHILFALSLKMIDRFGKGTELLDFLKGQLNLNINDKIKGYLMDTDNPHYAFDLLGLLKGELAGSFYINATSECPDVKHIIDLSRQISAIPAYPYLGDITDSVTGDKRKQKFEDDYIEELIAVVKDLGFAAVTYMPTRNSMKQLDNIRLLSDRYELFQICGEDINSSRQSFICEALRNEKFQNLIDAAWALVGHELAATAALGSGMFSPDSICKYPKLEERIKVFREIGLTLHQ